MKILLATDGSEYSECAARFLTRFHWSADDAITVFHAICWLPFRYDPDFYFDTLREMKNEIAPRILDSALDILKPVEAKKSVAFEDGSPEHCIIRAAVNLDVDMIVMGARGVKGIESLFIGSVTRSIVVDSPKPVLVVKRPAYAKPGAMRILLAADGSEHSRATAEFLASIPFADDSEVTVLNVIWSNFSDIPARFVSGKDDLIKRVAAEVQSIESAESEKIDREAGELLRKRFKNIRLLSRTGDPSGEILKTAEKTEADLIAVGCRGLRGIKRMMGSVSRNVLTHSKCSVLIGRTCR